MKKLLLVALPAGGTPEGFLDAAIDKAAGLGAGLAALYVVDSLWFRLSFSDWLSTGPSRAEFDAYMRDNLRREGESMAGNLSLAAARKGVVFSSEVVEGDTAEATLLHAGSVSPEAIILSFNHPALETIRKKSSCPVLVYGPGEPF